MIKFFKNNHLLILLFLVISALYFCLRIPNLTLQPIFADEAIYIRWAQVMKAEPTLRFLSMTDGKTPLFMWLMAPLFKIFADPLFAGRILSVIAGYLTLIGAFFLSFKFFNKNTAYFSILIIAITPFCLFFDRMALVDTMLASFSLGALILALLLIKYPRFDLAQVLGYILGGGILTKTSGMTNFLMLPVVFVSFNWSHIARQSRLIKTLLCFLIAIVIGLIIYNLLRLGVGFDMLSTRNQDYIFPYERILISPLDPLIPHLRDLSDWLPKLLTIPILLLSFYGIILAIIKRNKIAIAIIFWLIGPLLAECLFLKTFTARYIYSSIPPLLIIASFGLSELISHIKFNKLIKYLVALIIILPLALHFDFLLITNPEKAPLPAEEKRGYFEDWTAGYGMKEIADFLIKESQKQTIIVGTEGSFGTLPDGLMIYLDKYFHSTPDQKIMVVSGKSDVIDVLYQSAILNNTYFIANKSRVWSNPKNTELILKFDKATPSDASADAILVYKVLPVK